MFVWLKGDEDTTSGGTLPPGLGSYVAPAMAEC